MKKIATISAALLSGASGCASITQGTTQILSFNIEPKTAKCLLTRAGDGELGSVGGRATTISVGKDKDDILVQCSAPGYAAKTTRVVSGATTAGVTGVLLDFGITDMITGAMYAYPTDITIVMEQEGVAAAPVAQNTAPVAAGATLAAAAQPTREERLKELKHLSDSGLISKEIYLERQKEILAAP